jgi:protein gp37
MSDNSSIEWTEATWNPLLGCERVSPGCDACYAITTATIRAGNPHPRVAAAFEGLTERRDGRLDWTGRINLLPDRLTQPLRWRKPKRIFVNSQSDLFHKDVPDEYIARVFAVMALAPQHTFQLLTKRHARMRSLLSSDRFEIAVGTALVLYADHPGGAPWSTTRKIDSGLPRPEYWPLPNVWLGVSVEDQQRADIRIPALLETPAVVRWISAEPLLGPVDLDEHLPYDDQYDGLIRGVDWVVAGGESGPGARPMHPDWARGLRDQCTAAGVPFFLKQIGVWPEADRETATHLLQVNGSLVDRKNATSDNPYGAGSGLAQDLVDRGHPGWIRVRHTSKKFAGRKLDGRTWDEYPPVREVSGV